MEAATAEATTAAAAPAPAPASTAKSKAAKQAARVAGLHARSLALLQPDSPWTVEAGKAGRRAVATRAIAAGTTIVHEHAAGWVLRRQMDEKRCAHCAKPAQPDAPLRMCAGCRSFFYCSSECQSSSEALHAFVCPLVSKLEGVASETSCDADLLLLVATLIGGHLVEQRAAAANGGHAAESLSDGLTRATWLHVQDLMANRDTAQADWLAAIELGVKRLLQLYKGHAVFEGLQLPAADTLVSLCCRINSNSHSLFDNYSSSNGVVGLGLFPTTSILNHSCFPNCFFSGMGERMVVRSLRHVAPGEELTVPYIDLYQPRRDRLIELHADKHFVCACERCRAEEKAKFGVTAGSSASSSASASAAASAAVTSGAVASAAASSSAASAAPAIDTEQLCTWTCIGAVLCPVCMAKATAAELDQFDFGSKKSGRKKSKAAASAPSDEKHTSSSNVAAAPAVHSSAVAYASALSARQQGLLVWRGGGEEVKAVSGAPIASNAGAPKSWVCTRVGCGGRLTLAQVDELLSPLLLAFQRARSLQQQGRFADALAAFEQLLANAERWVPPDYILCMLSLTPLLNLSRQLSRVEVGERVLRRIVSSMERAFPCALPEISDFLVVLAEAQIDAAEASGTAAADVDARVHAARQLYQRAYDIRWIACGPDHPRTLNIEIPDRWRDRVAHTPRAADQPPPSLPPTWTDTVLGNAGP